MLIERLLYQPPSFILTFTSNRIICLELLKLNYADNVVHFCYLCFVVVVTYCERADLLALVCDVEVCFYHFPI